MKFSSLTMAFLLLAGSALAAADDLENAFQSLKQAEDQKDAAQVKRLAAETHALACEAAAAPAPPSDDEKDAWSKRVAYAKEIDLHTEYALYATASQSPPAAMVDLIAALEQQNPKSKYLDMAYGPYLVALAQTGSASKVPAIAEKALTSFPDNEDLLALLADNAYTAQQLDRALTYATRLTAVLNKHPKPEGISAAEWERHRNTELSRGYWIAGIIHGQKNVYAPADKELRAALPLIKGNNAMLAPALFYLGVVNYQLGKLTLDKARVLEAGKFSEQAAAIEGPYSRQAWQNALTCKADAARMR